MKLTWFGHAAVRAENGGYVILIDPFLSGNPKFKGTVDEAAHGATHSPAWAESSSSSAILRAARTSSLPVTTTMPSATGMPQAGESVRRPSICTAQIKHDEAGAIPGTWHMVGMRMPSHWAASSTVVPGGTLIGRPSIVKFTMARL